MKFKLIISLLTVSILFASCSEPFEPITDANQPLVVEGYIEAGPGSVPTYVILTRALPFITEIGPDQLGELFVN